MKKKITKIPKEKMILTVKIEAQMDGRSALHYKDYREGQYAITRLEATVLMDRIEALVNEFIETKTALA
jgi:hypothetical protein